MFNNLLTHAYLSYFDLVGGPPSLVVVLAYFCLRIAFILLHIARKISCVLNYLLILIYGTNLLEEILFINR